ncbi:hypothetical protein FKM82_023616 [Ascaphus truei]
MSTSTSSQPPTGQNPPRRSLPSAEGNPVQPKQALLKVLHTAGAKGDTFTLKQVMHYLGQYIMVKQLYDKQHQHIVNCGDDELGVLLGITSFSVKDPSPLYDMLKKNLHSVSCTDAAESPSRDQTQDTRGLERQKGPDEGTDVAESREGGDRDTGAAFSSRKHPAEDGDSPVSSKHPRLDLVFEEWDGAGLPWWFLGNLRPNYTPQSNGSTDIPSNQDIDTALVSDTTDDFWFLNDCRSDQINVEVKVEALESPPASEGDEAGENESTKVIELTIYGDDLEDTQSLSDDTDTDVTAEARAFSSMALSFLRASHFAVVMETDQRASRMLHWAGEAALASERDSVERRGKEREPEIAQSRRFRSALPSNTRALNPLAARGSATHCQAANEFTPS